MKKPTKEDERIPEFSSHEEEAAWFDTHDIGDYLSEFEIVEAQVERNLTKTLNVRLAPEIFAKLQQEADEKGVGTSTLVRMWILEKVRHGEMSGDG